MRSELFKAAEIDIVVFCGSEDHHSLYGGSADFQPRLEGLGTVHAPLIEFLAVFCDNPTRGAARCAAIITTDAR